MSTRSRSMTTHFITPGDSSDTRVTGTNPSEPSRGLGSRALAQGEAKQPRGVFRGDLAQVRLGNSREDRSEEHTSELQSQSNLVCRLLLEKKKNTMEIIEDIHPSKPHAQSYVYHVVLLADNIRFFFSKT